MIAYTQVTGYRLMDITGPRRDGEAEGPKGARLLERAGLDVVDGQVVRVYFG